MIALALAAGLLIEGQPARVIDGDTLAIGAEIVRIAGLDTPETWPGQAGCEAERRAGIVAKAALARLLATGPVAVERLGPVYPGPRTLARVTVSGRDVAADMIGAGFARPMGDENRRPWAVCRGE